LLWEDKIDVFVEIAAPKFIIFSFVRVAQKGLGMHEFMSVCKRCA
jgi:hypothetical protein